MVEETVPMGNVVPPITIFVTEEVVGGLELVAVSGLELVAVGVLELVAVGFWELVAVDVVGICVVRVTVIDETSTGLKGGHVAGILITSPGKMRSGFASCLFLSTRQEKSILKARARAYSESPATTTCVPPGFLGKLITCPGKIKLKSGICGFRASRTARSTW
jgi:hypothetical protein